MAPEHDGGEAPPPLGLRDVFCLQNVPWVSEQWNEVFMAKRQLDFGFVARSEVPAEWKGALTDAEHQWSVIETLFGRVRYASNGLEGQDGPTLVCAPGLSDRVPIDAWPSCRPGAVPFVPVFLLRTRRIVLGEEFEGRARTKALLIVSLSGPSRSPRARGVEEHGQPPLCGAHVVWPALHRDLPVWPLIQDAHFGVLADDPDAVWVRLLPLVPGAPTVNGRLENLELQETPRPWTPFAAAEKEDQRRLHDAMCERITGYGPQVDPLQAPEPSA